MSLENTPAKRKREDEGESLPVVLAQVRSGIWFEDGNIVLQAEATLFKVHRSMLARNSSVFKDMLAVPQPPMSQAKLVEDCAVVQLSDSAIDVTHVLRAISERSYAPLGEHVKLEVLTAFIRLGRKYNIETLRVEALRRLFAAVPITLIHYDNLVTLSDPHLLQIIVDGHRWTNILSVGREFGLESVLPIALFRCCRHIQSMSDGFTHNALRGISSDDKLLCYSSIKRLSFTQASTTNTWLTAEDIYSSCRSPGTCKLARSHAMRVLFYPYGSLIGLAQWSEHSSLLTNMCELCKTVAQSAHRKGRQEFWERLPDAFGLPAWEELKKERTNTLAPIFAESE